MVLGDNTGSTTLKLMHIFCLSQMLLNYYAVSLHSKRGILCQNVHQMCQLEIFLFNLFLIMAR